MTTGLRKTRGDAGRFFAVLARRGIKRKPEKVFEID